MRRILLLSLLSLSMLLASAAALMAAELPVIRVGYIHTTNHTPLMVAMAMEQKLDAGGYSLFPIIPKEKYELRKDGKALAMLDILVIKSGSETATLFAQKQLDVGLSSITAIMAGIDKNSPMKIVAPLVLASGGLVASKDFPADDWAGFIAQVKASKTPVSVGYHSPSSSPIIILEAALKSENIKVSHNPLDADAQVILVDLKGMPNLLPALSSKQVAAVVGPEPFPPTAVVKGAGKVLVQLRDMPPAGKWFEYPCCVAVASTDMIANRPEDVKNFVQFIAAMNKWCNEHNKEASVIGAKWIGLTEEMGKLSQLRFIPSFTDNWKEGAAGYMDVLNQANYFKGSLKGKSFKDAESILIDPRFLEQ